MQPNYFYTYHQRPVKITPVSCHVVCLGFKIVRGHPSISTNHRYVRMPCCSQADEYQRTCDLDRDSKLYGIRKAKLIAKHLLLWKAATRARKAAGDHVSYLIYHHIVSVVLWITLSLTCMIHTLNQTDSKARIHHAACRSMLV